jgi:hypothetical protein
VGRKYRSNLVGVTRGVQKLFYVGNDPDVTVLKPIEEPLSTALRGGVNWPHEYSFTSIPLEDKVFCRTNRFWKKKNSILRLRTLRLKL